MWLHCNPEIRCEIVFFTSDHNIPVGLVVFIRDVISGILHCGCGCLTVFSPYNINTNGNQLTVFAGLNGTVNDYQCCPVGNAKNKHTSI